MERLQKENLLLQHAGNEAIRAALTRWQSTLAHPASSQVDLPEYERWKSLSRELHELYDKKEVAALAGRDTSLLDAEILRVRREQRQGPQLQPGEILAQRFVLERILGHGGFASVWRAYDRRIRQMVAVKILHGQWSSDASRIDRFYRGARRMSELQHNAIVRVVTLPQQDAGFHFFAMEYLTGGDLRQLIINRQLSQQKAIAVLLKVCEALDFVHQRRMIHRDVKPSNILLDEQGHAHLTDFDLIYVPDSTGGTRTAGMGSIFYAAPEAMEDAKSVDYPAADTYSLGMTLAFIVYGKDLPQRAWTDRKRFWANLECSSELRSVIERATELDPAGRFESAGAFSAAVAAVASIESVIPSLGMPSITMSVGVPPFRAAKHGRSIGIGIFGMLGVVAVAWFLYQRFMGMPTVKPPQVMLAASQPVTTKPPARASDERLALPTSLTASPNQRPPAATTRSQPKRRSVTKLSPRRKLERDVQIPIVEIE